MDSTDQTISYYDCNAENYINNTIDVEFSSFQDDFISYLPSSGTILDLGCGSGRDSRAFIQKGFQVVAVDGSAKLCKAASQYIGQEVIHANFQDFIPDEMFDGIWACSSLLHLDKPNITKLIKTLSEYLLPGGCFYASFKYGNFSGERNGRFFTDLTEDSFRSIVNDIPDLYVAREKITQDVRPNRNNEQWLNVFMIKKCEKTNNKQTKASNK